MATQITTPAPAPATFTPSSLGTPRSPDGLVSFLDRRANGRPLDWRAGLPPTVGGLSMQPHRQHQQHKETASPLPASRDRSRAARDSPERVRYAMHDFVKSTVWANHDMLQLRPSAMDCCSARAVFVDGAHGERLHVHDDVDGTTHMVLAAADAATAIEHGWAQADPLASARAWACDSGVQSVTVFAPRCASELGDWKRLVLASMRVCTAASQTMVIRRPERL